MSAFITRLTASLARPSAVASSSRLFSSSTTVSASPVVSPPSASAPPSKYLEFPPLVPRKPKHNIHVATLHLRSHHPTPLDLFSTFALHSAHSLRVATSLPSSLPSTRSLYTVLKSPFVHKKAQENFERRTHKRCIKVYDSSRENIDLWLRYLRKNAVGGVGLKAVVFEWVDFGFGRKELEGLEADMAVSSAPDDGVMEQVGKKAEELIKSLQAGGAAEMETAQEVEGQAAEVVEKAT
ncbi:small subunit ribosomal protein S10, partial [Tremellales sp. Uapishka_1]